jgi:hypothetical protein
LTAGLVHVVCAGLRGDVDAGAIEAARALAIEMVDAPSAVAVAVGESTTHLLVATWLESRNGLEAFAASPAHMAFIMRGVARVTSGMWSAAAEIDAPAPVAPKTPCALFVFGVRAHTDGPQLYEWEVRALLDGIAALPGTAAAGPTFEERDRFRAAGAVVIDEDRQQAFVDALGTAGASWGDARGAIEWAVAPVTGFARRER